MVDLNTDTSDDEKKYFESAPITNKLTIDSNECKTYTFDDIKYESESNEIKDDIEYSNSISNSYSIENNNDKKLKKINISFDLYHIPRMSDNEFELLDIKFYQQCSWMKLISPIQLGVESLYWCDIPPSAIHANSDICINIKSDEEYEGQSIISSKTNYTNHVKTIIRKRGITQLKSKSRKIPKKINKLPKPKIMSAGGSYSSMLSINSSIDDNKQDMNINTVKSDGNPILKSNTSNLSNISLKNDDNDYSKKPYGEALLLIECLDELTTPFDLNECLGNVVDVIFRTAQSYRKYNIHNQNKLLRTSLALGVSMTESKKMKENNVAIGADIFFPIFIWVLVNCKIKNIHRSVYIMSHYNDSDAMKTKIGYNVSTLHSALDHIMRAKPQMYITKDFSKRK